MPRFLMTPIRLDALHLAEPLTVADALADFSRLPYFDGARDVNADTAYISENLVATPFHNQQLPLPRGVHLHWALPDALTRSHPVDKHGNAITFPAVPNLWLVSRRRDHAGTRHWIVESDYLYPEGQGAASGSICYPVFSGRRPGQPFRYMGRQLPLEEWLARDRTGEAYLQPTTGHPFTALGYGEPTFAAFYPNCHSVFGFHDPEPPHPPAGTVYYVTGWYRDGQEDFCTSPVFLKALASQKPPGFGAALQRAFNWTVPDDGGVAPTRLLCYARTTLTPEGGSPGNRLEAEASLKVAVGNTATEALSAYLAHEFACGDSTKRGEMEDRLESLHLMGDLEHRQLDVGPKFREARHAGGFRSSGGGSLWTIRLNNAGADGRGDMRPEQVTLPDELAHALNQLNLAQQRFDTARANMNSLRQRLFADWYRYMLSAYPPDDQRGDYPDVDAVRFFIEEHDLKPLADLERTTGAVALQRTNARVPPGDISALTLGEQLGHWWNHLCDLLLDLQVEGGYAISDWEAFGRQLDTQHAPALADLPSSPQDAEGAAATTAWQTQVLAALTELAQRPDLVDILPFPGYVPAAARELLAQRASQAWSATELQRYNRLLLQAYFPALGSPYGVHRIGGPRYWQPNEPVVLLSGPAVAPSDRHGPAEAVHCSVAELDDALLTDAEQRVQAIDALFQDVVEVATRELEALVKSNKTTRDQREQAQEQLKTLALQALAERDNATQAQRAEARQQLETLTPREVAGFRFSRGRPWHPFMLEWEVRVEPVGGLASNLHSKGRSYDPSYINTNFKLAENAVELTPASDNLPAADHALYMGRSILVPQAKLSLRRQIDAYFEKQVLGAYYAAHETAVPSPNFFNENRQAVIDWCKTAAPGVVDDFMRFVLEIEEHVGDDFHLLAQSLSGLNAAFLGHKQTMQLSVADPLGFPEYREFADRVHDAVGTYTRVAPQPMNDFNPIRSGRLHITRLRLIDTFGRHRDLTNEELGSIVCSDTLHNDAGSERAGIALPPRLMQPARLDLNWKSNGHGPGHRQEEDHDDVEMNAHPATSPICGWLLPNNLDGSLMVYSQAGQALGYLDRNNRWRIAPGSSSGVHASSAIDNPHLRRVVQWLEREDAAFHDTFLATLDSALENIDPDNWAHHQDLALLMGRPLAVVRASLQLKLKGLPAINQSWDVFWQDLHSGRQWDADTDRVQDVLFPVRLGEHRQLNDGVAGYWLEAEDGSLSAGFYAPQSDVDDAGGAARRRHLIHTYRADQLDPDPEQRLQVPVRANGPAVALTLLLDPRGKLHATSGILPVQIVDIPPDQYAASLQAIEVSFLSAPILSQRRQEGGDQPPELPLPEEPGYQWRWAERDANAQWHVTAPSGEVNRQARFAGPLEVREGWLLLSTSSSDPED